MCCLLSMVSGLRTWYIIQKKKLKRKRKRHELCEARTHAIKSKIGHRDHLTILPKIHILIFRGARSTHRTHMHSTAKEREAVMTDDGSKPPIEQLATAVHRGPATRSWCGPLMLVLLGKVVTFGCSLHVVRYLDLWGEFRGRNTKHRKY